ncbi:unnamed protein product, partial [Iphiclides podalirius]
MYGSRERTTVSRDATALPTPAQPRRISCRNMWRATSLPYRDRFTVDSILENVPFFRFSSFFQFAEVKGVVARVR